MKLNAFKKEDEISIRNLLKDTNNNNSELSTQIEEGIFNKAFWVPGHP